MRKRESKTASGALLVDTAEAGRLLGLGRSSIVNLADSGELPRVRLGRAVRFSTADVEALVQRRRSASSSERRAAASGIYRLMPPGPDDVA